MKKTEPVKQTSSQYWEGLQTQTYDHNKSRQRQPGTNGANYTDLGKFKKALCTVFGRGVSFEGNEETGLKIAFQDKSWTIPSIQFTETSKSKPAILKGGATVAARIAEFVQQHLQQG